jgi:hypothetical protein
MFPDVAVLVQFAPPRGKFLWRSSNDAMSSSGKLRSFLRPAPDAWLVADMASLLVSRVKNDGLASWPDCPDQSAYF